MKKRKVCFVITSFIHYSRNLLILEELNKTKNVELHVIVGGAALLTKYLSKHSDIKKILKNDGIKNIYEVYFNLEGDKAVVKAKTAGMGTIEFSSLYNRIKPDIVLLRGDRFEILSAAIAAAYMNIPIAHIEGGDVSGTIDESVRHAITKLAHIHFPTNNQAEERLIRMGEDPKNIFNFGSPDIEVIDKISNGKLNNAYLKKTGSGKLINLKDNYLMVMYHPVATELDKIGKNTRILLNAIAELNMPTFWFWPNFDAGAEEISHEIRIFKDENSNHKIRFMRYLPPREFLSLLKNTKCFIGNSSAGIKECSYLGIPVVNIGSRQDGRLRAENVVDVEHDSVLIKKAIKKQLEKGRFNSSKIYKLDGTSKNIAKVLASIDVDIQKKFND